MSYPLWQCLNKRSKKALRELMPDDWIPPADTGKHFGIIAAVQTDEEYIHLRAVTREMEQKPRCR